MSHPRLPEISQISGLPHHQADSQHCKISKGKLTEILIEFMYERFVPLSRRLKKMYKLDTKRKSLKLRINRSLD